MVLFHQMKLNIFYTLPFFFGYKYVADYLSSGSRSSFFRSMCRDIGNIVLSSLIISREHVAYIFAININFGKRQTRRGKSASYFGETSALKWSALKIVIVKRRFN